MATKIWLVTYTDENDSRGEDEPPVAFRSEERALLEVARLIGRIVKEEREAIEWDSDQLKMFDDVEEALSKGDIREAYELWRDLSSELDFAEEVLLEESTLS